jgi:hypothetical protein
MYGRKHGMDQIYIAAIGATIYGVIREIGGQIVAVKKTNNEVETAENAAYKARTDRQIAELRADYEMMRGQLSEAERRDKQSQEHTHQCEKDKIRLEGKLDLLTKLFIRDLPNDSKLHEALKDIDKPAEKVK